MFFRLLLLFTLVPLIELTLLLQLSAWHGWQLTLLLVIVTGVLGTFLARQQGLAVWWSIRREMSAGRPPTTSLMEGMLILLAGALLLTPGILTDAVGFLLLWPRFRRLLIRVLQVRLAQHVRTHMQAGPGFVFQQFEVHSESRPDSSRAPTGAGDEVIDVEFQRVEKPPQDPPK